MRRSQFSEALRVKSVLDWAKQVKRATVELGLMCLRKGKAFG